MVQKQFSAWWTHKSKVRLTFSCLTATTQCCLFPVHHSRGSCSRLAVLLLLHQPDSASIFSQITCVALRSFCWGFLACEARGTASPISIITSPNELLSLPLCSFIHLFSHFALESQRQWRCVPLPVLRVSPGVCSRLRVGASAQTVWGCYKQSFSLTSSLTCPDLEWLCVCVIYSQPDKTVSEH